MRWRYLPGAAVTRTGRLRSLRDTDLRDAFHEVGRCSPPNDVRWWLRRGGGARRGDRGQWCPGPLRRFAKEEVMRRGKRLLFGTIFGTVLLVVTLVGIE